MIPVTPPHPGDSTRRHGETENSTAVTKGGPRHTHSENAISCHDLLLVQNFLFRRDQPGGEMSVGGFIWLMCYQILESILT
jgi:hypothetical protein